MPGVSSGSALCVLVLGFPRLAIDSPWIMVLGFIFLFSDLKRATPEPMEDNTEDLWGLFRSEAANGSL